MINTTAPTRLSSSSSTAPTQLQNKLTKKQKKALAFRDKSSRTKTPKTPSTPAHDEQEAEVQDLHVSDMEEPNGGRNASASVQMGDVEDRSTTSTSRRSSSTNARTKGPSQSSLPSILKSSEKTQSRAQSKRKQLSEISQVRFEQRGGDRNAESEKVSAGKKRKRDSELDDGMVDGLVELGRGGGEEGGKEGSKGKKDGNKKRKREKVESGVDGAEEGEGEEMNVDEVEGEGTAKGKGKEKQRFILFIGNLKYTTSVDTIKSHFSACDPPPDVRLLTPKASATGKTTTKSKGCAFLEFENKAALQQALKLHHSMLDGRMINVELTAGGGGKGEKRMEKLRERNKELLGQRKKKADKKGKKGSDDSLPSRPDKPQRYSATSGMEQSEPGTKRTWTVSDEVEDEVHRGGQKHKKERSRGSRKSKMKDWATGVNAIPVG